MAFFTTSPAKRSQALQGALDYQRFVDLQNERLYARDEDRRPAQGLTLPVVSQGPQASGLNEQSQAQKAAAAQAQAAARANAAKAKAAQAQPTQAVRSSDPDSFAGQGLQLVDFDPNSNIDNRGLAIRNNPNLSQFQKDVGGGFNRDRFDTRLRSIRYGLSSGNVRGVDTGPATGIFGQIKGYFADTEDESAARQAQGVITDWYDSDEAEQYFMQNPIELERAINDPVGVYRSLKETATPLAVPTQTTQPTTQAGVSTTRNGVPVVSMDIAQPTTQTAGVTIKDSTGATRKLTKQQPGIAQGVTSVAKSIDTKPISKLKEPGPMPLTVRVEELRGLQQQREDIKRQMRMALGTPGAASRLESKLDANSVLIENLATQQALDTFNISDDPRMLSQILSQQSGQNVLIGKASEDTWYMSIDGQILEQRWNKKQMVSQQRRESSKKLRDSLSAAQIAADADLRGKIIDNQLSQRLENVKGNYKLMAEQYKQAKLIKGIDDMFKQDFAGNVSVLTPVEGEDGKTRLEFVPISQGSPTSAYKL